MNEVPTLNLKDGIWLVLGKRASVDTCKALASRRMLDPGSYRCSCLVTISGWYQATGNVQATLAVFG